MAIITVSRGSMSGGESLATCLAEVLHYPMVGRDVLVEAAEKLGVSEETLTQKVTRSPGLFERVSSNRRFYMTAVQAALAAQVLKGEGNLVYHGHAGHLLLRGLPAVLRVRLIAPIEMRVRAVIERQKLSREAAVDYIHHVDEERARWTKFIYGVDWSDPALYDLVINLGNLSIQAACAMLATAVGQDDLKTTEAVRQKLVDFELACRVKLALAVNLLTRDLDFEVNASDGVVEISGELPRAGLLTQVSERDAGEVRKTASTIEGVKAVHLNLKAVDFR